MTRRWIAAACVALATTIAGCSDRMAPRSLKDETSSFRLKTDAPDTSFVLAQTGDGIGQGGPESSFGQPPAPGSIFRAAEIPEERLAATNALMSDLKARQLDDRSIAIDLPSDVLFDFDKAVLRADAQAPLAKAAELIASYPEAPLAVKGHTDGKGSDAYNLPLSERRARAVADWLAQKTGRIPAASGYGKREPLVPNTRSDGTDDPDGRQRNRRVEILIRPLPPSR